MSNDLTPQTPPADSPDTNETESFGDLLAQFEGVSTRIDERGAKQIDATVVSLDAESVYLDIGYKTEGILPRTAFENNAEAVNPGDKFPVSVKGRNEEGYYELSRHKVVQPTDWSSLEAAFAAQDRSRRHRHRRQQGRPHRRHRRPRLHARLPQRRPRCSRDGKARRPGDHLPHHQARRRRRRRSRRSPHRPRRAGPRHRAKSLRRNQRGRHRHRPGPLASPPTEPSSISAASTACCTSPTSPGAASPPPKTSSPSASSSTLKVLKIDREARRISVGLKQLQPEPWDTATERYTLGQRITGTVTRLMDFGAFVELEPGIEGLIHVSEMSWVKKVHKPSDILKPGDTVDAVILSISPAERRIGLGLKQTLGDPWADVAQKFPVGSAIEGPVTRLMKFGAFVQLTEGIEGLVHISEIVADRHLNHPQDAVRAGQIVKAQVLALDPEKRQIKLSMKQLIPTGLDEFLAEHNEGDTVSGRVVEQSGDTATIELGEGIRATCRLAAATPAAAEASSSPTLDLSALTSMLNSRWKTGTAPATNQPQPLQPGQIRSFRITTLDREAKKLDLTLA